MAHRPDSDAVVTVLLKGEHQNILRTTPAASKETCDVLLETWLGEREHPETQSNAALRHNTAREGQRL